MHARAIFPQDATLSEAPEPSARHRFTYREVWAMQQAEVLDPEMKFELLEGDIVPMQSKLHRHEIIKTLLVRFLNRRLPDEILVWPKPSFYIADDHVPDPDIFITRAGVILQEVRGPEVLLVIEVADSSLRYDLGRKALLYARHGVPEYWVVNAKTLDLHVHRGPSGDGWTEVVKHGPASHVSPMSLSDVSVRLDLIIDLAD